MLVAPSDDKYPCTDCPDPLFDGGEFCCPVCKRPEEWEAEHPELVDPEDFIG
jgi:hypothetical protein